MRTWIYKVAFVLMRTMFWLRYKVEYVGLDQVQERLRQRREASGNNHPGNNHPGILFLPNHPAVFNDPLIVIAPLLPAFHARPLITEYMYYNPLFHPILRWIGALPVPNFSVGVNSIKLDRLQKTLDEVEASLLQGKNFVLYPAGVTKASGREIIGGSFAAHDLVQKHSDVSVVLVRTEGLWGSRFSRARSASMGDQVDMGTQLKESFRMLMKSLIFFLPRRPVRVEFQLASLSETASSSEVYLPINQGRKEFNRALERWYNLPFERLSGLKAGEPLQLIAESCWSRALPYVAVREEKSSRDVAIPAAIQEKIIQKIADLAGKPASSVQIEDHLVADVGLDSLNIAELITFIEVQYDQRGINPQEMTSVLKACLYGAGKLESEREQFDPLLDTSLWEQAREVHRLYIPESETLIDAFFTTASMFPKRVAAADARAGVISYGRMKKAIFLLAREIAKIEGDTVGILLPASVMANILIFATQLAGKIPVMVNWTVGGSHLDSVLEQSKMKVVLTSWSFLDRLENVDLRPLKSHIVVLEERKATFSWGSYLIAAISAKLPWEWVKKYSSFFPAWSAISGDTPAVILFTSGTESMPKGVPLTHANVLTNLQSALHAIEIFSSDRVLSMLPPFHSFGFSVTGIMPLIAGIRAYYSPNPLDAPRLTQSLRYWKATILCSAPSFLKNILRQSKGAVSFDAIRLVVSGAERAPDDLYEMLAHATPHATFVEGYGITECSPVLTLNVKGRAFGVGSPMSNVRLKIVDPENYQSSRDIGQPGMILVQGPNVFHGYLNPGQASPFWFDGSARWYVTGDIGLIDEWNNLHITGRLKRFVKIGGEMISLGAVEQSLERAFSSQIPKWQSEREARLKSDPKPGRMLLENISTSAFAVISHGEAEGRPKLILVSLFPVTQVEVNMALRTSGFSNLVKVDQVLLVDEFPLMGTGKIAYRALDLLVV